MDCINVADETVAAINQSMVQLKELNLQVISAEERRYKIDFSIFVEKQTFV